MRLKRLPSPTAQYDLSYMNALVNDLNLILASLNSVSSGSFTTVNISQLPTSATGLRAGDLWNDSGTVKVVT